MFETLRRPFGAKGHIPTGPGPLWVDHPHYVIGDIHGCFALLLRLQDAILAHAAHHSGMQDAKVVFIGDYVDRGEDSAAVLQHLYELSQEDPDRYVFLMGNHEKMMLDFLDNPGRSGARWLRHGGLQTLASFGVRGVTEHMSQTQIQESHTRFRAALPGPIEAWVRGLPKFYQTGNLICVHAAMDPALPIEAQSEQTYLWGHSAFLNTPRTDRVWVAHGHTIMDQAAQIGGRVQLDTGAYATGCLSAVGVMENQVWFVSTK